MPGEFYHLISRGNNQSDLFLDDQDRKRFLFEHLFYNQLVTSATNADTQIRISTYRTEHGAEVDLIAEINKKTLAELLKERAKSIYQNFQFRYG